MRTTRYVLLLIGLLAFLSGCTIKTSLFGGEKLSLPSSDNLQAVKGTFPIISPFTAEFKNYIRAAPDKKFVFADFNGKIHVVNDSGILLTSFEPADTSAIDGLFVDSSSHIYITGEADAPNQNDHRFLRKYDISGNYLGEIITYGDEDPGAGTMVGLPRNPYVADDGTIYVTIFEQIRKYNSSGVLLTTFGTIQGANDGELHGSPSFTVNSDGSLYVADVFSDRVQKFNADGSYNSKFMWPRQIPGSVIEDLSRNPDGSFVISERMGGDGRITSFSSTGSLLWSLDGTENGGTKWDSNLLTYTKYDGKYYVGFREGLYVYASDGTYLKDYATPMQNPMSITQALNGTFFVGTTTGVHQYNAKGEWQRLFGPNLATAMVVSSQNVLYVANLGSPTTIYKFDLNGNALGTINVPGLAAPYGMSIDKNDNIYIADGGGAGLVVLSTVSQTASAFPTAIAIVAGVHIAQDGTILVLDFDGTNSTPKRFNAAGALLDTFDAAGADITLGAAFGITELKDGRVVITSATKNKVYTYEADGTYVTSFGGTGASLDKFNQAWAIFADLYGNIFVADNANSAIKKFSPAGTVLFE
ncbi:NHL repeat-containing protein [Bdellovibrio bacteriovorus]|uniref:NHL repeat-containing protein n=1 Tax=Bdellovibrio bacteriovorus TaxID=959 RepID=UPI0035A6DEC9